MNAQSPAGRDPDPIGRPAAFPRLWRIPGHPGTLYAMVALGSLLGGSLRFVTSEAMLAAFGPGFPWGTLVVNVLGSFLIGLYATLTAPGGRLPPRPALQHLVMTGFCGGFTTFSIFSLEALLLFQGGALPQAALHVGGSVVVWLAAVWAGHAVATGLNGRGRNRVAPEGTRLGM
ncbi:MAG: chromosome condensation protein CrcB [Rhodospirillales bacterium]|nr:MAG: chromosome condensation protein CrcB [Rhodospirillales bacterium]